MKKLHVFLILALTVSFIACKKDSATKKPYKCASCKTSPDAVAANDASSKGIYKGIVVGSSGTIMFDIANAGSTITAVMVIDGVTANLSAAVTWASGQPYISDFTGTLGGQPVSIMFSVGMNGSNPTVLSSNIPGHPNAVLSVVKETSNHLVEAFEGSYSTTRPETGTFNIFIARTAGFWGGVSRETGSSTADDANGIITGNNLYDSSSTIHMGTLSGDELNGSFVDDNGKTVTIHGTRTM